VSQIGGPSILPASVDEDAVRRLCGAAFAEADTLQRAGHVLGPKRGTEGLSADVRGVWRRIDQVTIGIKAGRLAPICSRDGTGFCRHAGALLLQVLRDPGSVVETAPETPEAAALAVSNRATAYLGVAQSGRPTIAPIPAETETPEAELARLLENDTVPHLREMARRRGVRAAGSKKADVLASLVPTLTDPASIEAALTALTTDERRVVDAVHLASVETAARSDATASVYRLLGGEGLPPPAVHDAGLVLPASISSYEATHLVPRAVVAHLAPLDNLATPLERAPEAPTADGGLGIVELLQVVALALLTGDPVRVHESPPSDGSGPPTGYAFAGGATPSRTTLQTEGPLLVPAPFLDGRDRERLVERTGQRADVVDFAVRLMLALGVAEANPDVVVRRDRLQALLDLSAPTRRARLVRALAAIAGPPEIASALQAPGRLRLRWRLTYGYGAWFEPLEPVVASAIRLLVRLLDRLPPAVWLDLGSFVETVERLAPSAAPNLIRLRTAAASNQGLTIVWTNERGREEKLPLRTPEGWSRFLSALVGALLSGPLRWLGLVDAVVRPDRTGAFRARRATEGLVPAEGKRGTSGRAQIDADLTVLVPAGTADVSIHGRLARAGELVEASAAGLRYRLTAARMQDLFESGMTGPEFARFLTELSGRPVPPEARQTLDGWWSGYGAIRLYDELALLELGDDLLQRELSAATSLGTAIVHVFSPRLIAVDPARVDGLVAELTSRGYAPRVVEEG
jgi:hypothetical protein